MFSFKIFPVLLLGLIFGISACGNETLKSDRILSQPAASPQQSQVQSAPTVAGADRANYKSIPLDSIASAKLGSDPKEIADKAFDNFDSEGGTRDVRVQYPQPNRAIVSITQTGLADDSVAAIRFRVEFVPQTPSGGSRVWLLDWAGSQVKCRVGRGHQDWSAQNCR